MSDPTPSPEPTLEPTPDPTPEPSPFTAPASQEELDRIIEARLARERKRFEGFDAIKEKAAKWDQLEEEKKTPSEKAIEEAAAKARAEVASKYERQIAEGRVESIAAAVGFIDPADAVLRVLSGDLPKKDDELDVDELKKRVEQLAKDKPHLVKTEQRQRPGRQEPKPGVKVAAAAGEKGKAAAAIRQLRGARG
ncbi:hypothetical protein [Microcella frigidaquae]|uniref:Scaffolding protein n=1 Tax=Microcella frigidaquae TaxID=424758 RepID=A0A840XKM1_9MICO|nr:hypothetical protein [Microcella frigidaquae]MBB5617208.1 hypothetical protein [Microcella frigidaquae]NHN45091.1 hypothetical protein [Microcella frigidaquae]